MTTLQKLDGMVDDTFVIFSKEILKYTLGFGLVGRIVFKRAGLALFGLGFGLNSGVHQARKIWKRTPVPNKDQEQLFEMMLTLNRLKASLPMNAS